MKKEAKTTMPKRRNVTERGLVIDNGDERRSRNETNAVKNAKDGLQVGYTLNREWNQQVPFFWTREGNACNNLIGHFRGTVAFLICGGPSFKKVPKTKLNDCWTMGINNSPASYRPNSWVSVDDPSRFVKSIWLDPQIMKFVPYGMPDKDLWDEEAWQPLGLTPGDCPNMYYFKRNNKFHAPRWMTETTFNWGNHKKNGGCRSVMLPAIRILYVLGFRTVYLLGCDFDMDKDKGYHFDQVRDKGAVKGNMSSYKRMNEEYFPALRPYFEKLGFNVFNCNGKSKLTAFDFVSFEQAHKHATEHMGDLKNPKTKGMYQDPKEKFKQYYESLEIKEQKKDNKKGE